MYAQFISTDYLKKWTIIPSNTEDHLLTKFIRQAQDISIKESLGNDLYFTMMNKMLGGTLTGAYLSLMTDFVYMAQAEWATYYALPFIQHKLTNIGIVDKSTSNSDPVSKSDFVSLRNEIKSSAEHYSKLIREEILNNQGSYPEYFTVTGIDRTRPRANSYTCGIYLPDRTYNNNLPHSHNNGPDR